MGGSTPHACFGTVQSPIQMMINEHEAAGALLENMRTSTQGFTPPSGACPTLVGLLHGLDAFEKEEVDGESPKRRLEIIEAVIDPR